MARFHSALYTATQRAPLWWIDCFERTFTSLECDCLRGNALLSKIVAQAGEAEAAEEGGGTTSAAKVTLED
eukprot:12395618-Alexandrium_andersonii.AAC.1